MPLGPLPWGVSTLEFGTPLRTVVDYFLLAWFCILQALLSFPWTIVDLGSILLGFYFLFFGSFVLGGSGVLSLGAGFLFMLRNTVVTLGPWNIMLYMVGRWRYIACSC